MNIEALYYVQRKHSQPQSNNTFVQNVPSLVHISSCNIIAFVTPNNIQDLQNSVWGCHLYVCDIATPWNTFKVTSNKSCITVLEWDISGRYLLVGDAEGTVQIWVQKDYYLNDWIQLYTIQLPGERIMKAVFFHNGRRIAFSPDKREVVPYMDKFQRIRYPPSVRQFGGASGDGCLVITSTGLLGSCLLSLEQSIITQNLISGNLGIGNQGNLSNNTGTGGAGPNVQINSQQQSQPPPVIPHLTAPLKITPITQSLGASRNFLSTVAVSYGRNISYSEESFRIATGTAESRNKPSITIFCYRVIMKITDGKLTMKSQSLPSFFLFEGAGRDLPDLKVTNLCWNTYEDTDSIIIVAKHKTGSFIELWSLVEKVTPIHKLLQTNKTEVYKSLAWTNVANFRHASTVIDISVSKLAVDNPYVYFTMADSTIQVFTKDLKRIAGLTTSAINLFDNNEMHPPKHPRLDIRLVAHDVTYLGHLMISIDTLGQLYAIKLPQSYHELCGSQLSVVANITSLLEYSIISGYDCIDVFVTIRPNLLEQVIDKLTENFTRQPSSVQQYYYVNFLTTKTNLYRLSASGQSKVHDLQCLLMLHSILIAFKSLLRPADLGSHDKGPAENLAMVLSESVPDVDKVLLNLDAKDFTVEPLTLQSLQQLIQWVADLALNILVKLPQNSNMQMSGQSKNHGYEISKDIVALNSIRELLVMIRIWGLLNTQCLPRFSPSVENQELLATLFRLLTRLALNPTEPDEGLLDECFLLQSQVLIPQLNSSISVTSITSPVLHLNNFPLQLTYDTEPESLKFCREFSLGENSLVNNGMVDSIKNILLGKQPFAVRKCIRCGTYSSVSSVAKTAAMKAWEQRWGNTCRCGGFWIYLRN